MPIDLYSSVNKVSHFAFGSTLLNSLFSNTVVTALIITFIMVLAVMILYPARSGTPIMEVVKMFIYMFIFNLIVIFVHDGVIKYVIKEQYQDKDSNELMQGTNISGRNPVYGQNYVSVDPSAYNNLQYTPPQPAPPISQPAPQPVPQPAPQPTPQQQPNDITILGGGILGGKKPPLKAPNVFL
jgi:hypothetical protein